MSEAERQSIMRRAASIMPVAVSSSSKADFLSREHTVAKTLLDGLVAASEGRSREEIIAIIRLAAKDVEKLRRKCYCLLGCELVRKGGRVLARWPEPQS